MAPRRLPPPPGTEQREVGFDWGRWRVRGVEGDTVASALLAAGHGVLSRSIKYHRPRSYLCGVGKCANCFVTIDGKPSQKACMVPLRGGMVVRGQNAWPSTRWDLFGLTDAFFARGFDPQRTLTKPRSIVPLYYRVVRRMAGLGQAPRDDRPARPAPVAREEVALAVVGGGPAGLAAALEAARAGVPVRVFDEQPWAGGRLGHETEPLEGRTPREALRHLLTELQRAGAPGPEQRTTVAGIYGERVLAVHAPGRLVEVRAGAVVLATGAPESLPLFGDNDRPGVMGAGGAAVLLHRHGVLPGRRAVLVGSDARLVDLGRALVRAGARVEAIVGEPADAGGLRVVSGAVQRALGTRWVTGVEVRAGRATVRLACDLVVFGEPRRPAVELAQQAGCALAERGGALAPRVERGATSVPKVFAAGDLVAPATLHAALLSGRVAGLRAAQALGAKVDEARLAAAEEALASEGP